MSGDSRPEYSVYLETYGCQMNVYDSSAIAGYLTADGFVEADDCETADVVLLNTCSVRDHAEHRVISRVGELRRQRERQGLPPALLGICGCMAERLGESLLKNNRRVDLAVGVDQYDRLAGLLRSLLGDRQPAARALTGHRDDLHYVAPPELYPTNNSHLVTIHKGCDYRCTYCIVPATRGPQREKSPEVILDEIRRIVDRGGKEVTLLGQNVTAYRWDEDTREPTRFANLLELVAETAGVERIRFLTGHPRDMDEQLLTTIGDLAKVCPWLHIPMQSGNDRILRRMKRLYTRADYLAMIDSARRLIPDVSFSSDFIVGFPGETEEEFRDTLEVIREVGYDQIFSFKYSERPDVPAAKLDDNVSVADKKRRLAELMAVQDEAWQRLASAQVGEVWQGVIEGEARRPAGAWRMRTANNRKVLLELPDAQVGQRVTARVTGFQNTTFRGEPLKDPR